VADTGFYISIGTAVAVIGYAIRATWVVRTLEKEMREEFDAEIDNVQRDIVKLERLNVDRCETIMREFGETCSAIRQKLHDVEVYTRDTFVRKDSFELVVGRLEKSLEKMTDRLETKIDKAVERFSQN
jgi:hypothetical protein